jgi:rubrerythrin
MVQSHIMSVPLAVQYGSSEALFLSNICWWLEKNRANEQHFHDGRYWTYNTMAGFTELFPYFTVHQIQHIISKLRDKGILFVANYNKIGYDRTNWYSVSDEAMALFLGALPVTESSYTEPAGPEKETTMEMAPNGSGEPKPLPVTTGQARDPGDPPICPNGHMHSGNFPDPSAQTGTWEEPGQPSQGDSNTLTPEKGSKEGGNPEKEREMGRESAVPDPETPPICPNGHMHLGNFHHPSAQTGTCIREISQIDPGNIQNRSGKSPGPIPSNKPVNKPAAAPAGNEQKAAAADSLKTMFMGINPTLVFDEQFYPKAKQYMQACGLDNAYLRWLYEVCQTRKPASLRMLYYSLFFKTDMRDLFLLETRETETAAAVVTCPVCGTAHGDPARTCPVCGLSREDRNNEDEVMNRKAFYMLSPEDKKAFIKKTFRQIYELTTHPSGGS